MDSRSVMEAFESLVDAAPAEREGILLSLEGLQPGLAEECRRLLRAHVAAERGEFLAASAFTQVLEDSSAQANQALQAVKPPVPIQESKPPHPEGFRLAKVLGRGGFGEVWIAENSTTHAVRAAKMIPDSAGVELDGLRRLTRAVAGHAGLVQIEHVGLAEDWLYAVMPLADPAESSGAVQSIAGYRPLSLDAYAARRVALASTEVARIGAAIAAGLAALHEAGLAHGDVKPQNVLRFEGAWRLGDYSVVHAVDHPAFIGGTPDYLPPEGGGGVAADQYALAVTLFTIATRQPATDFASWRDGGLSSEDSRAARLLDAAIRRAGAAEPRQRFPSMAAFERELVRIGRMQDPGRRAARVVPWILGAALVAAIGITAIVIRGQRTNGSGGGSTVDPSIAAGPGRESTASARIERLSVRFRPARADATQDRRIDSTIQPLGTLPPLAADAWEFRVSTELRSDAYVYLLYLQPDGLVVPYSPESATHATTRLAFPTNDGRYVLDRAEGVGQAGVVVIASANALPEFEAWAVRPAIEDAWGGGAEPEPEAAGQWWVFNGLELLAPAATRGVERPVEAQAATKVQRVVDVLVDACGPNGDVHAVFFPVGE
ncbi:MAG: hypothetical protein R3B68_07370 [Phycisphaerales bacterium]